MAMNENYEWYLSANLEKHVGRWVVIVNKRVVAEGNDIRRMLEDAKARYPNAEPLLVKVPTKETLILSLSRR